MEKWDGSNFRRKPIITDIDIKALKNYFENRKDIAFAFLFGSEAGIDFRQKAIDLMKRGYK